MTIVNTTVWGNLADEDGGGIKATGSNTLTAATSSTITANIANGVGESISLATEGSTANVSNSVVAHEFRRTRGHRKNRGQLNHQCESELLQHESGLTINSGIGNLFGDVVGDPGLGILADNGGPVETAAPLDDSPLPAEPATPTSSATISRSTSTAMDTSIPTCRSTPSAMPASTATSSVPSRAPISSITTANDDSVGGTLADDRLDGEGLSLREAIRRPTRATDRLRRHRQRPRPSACNRRWC